VIQSRKKYTSQLLRQSWINFPSKQWRGMPILTNQTTLRVLNNFPSDEKSLTYRHVFISFACHCLILEQFVVLPYS
jgi:hypothetical protein